MNFLGLHWKTDDGTPLQLLIENRTLHVWARSCPRGGEWTGWRRLDVERNADGTLNETVATATNAKSADTATRLAKAVSINLTGAITGSAIFDGAQDVFIETGGGSLSDRVSALEGGLPPNEVHDHLSRLWNTVGGLLEDVDKLKKNMGSGE